MRNCRQHKFYKEINIAFFDGAEDEIYNELLNSNEGKLYELSWEKEKVSFEILGIEEDRGDDTKAKIQLLSVSEEMNIELKTPFTGAIKIVSGSQDSPSLDKQIEELKKQIEALEQKLRDTPDSDASLKNSYREQVRALRNSLAQKEREKSQSEKDGFPTKLVVGISVGALVTLLVVFIFMQFNKRRDY